MDDRWITDGIPSERFPFYTRANSGEIMPAPTTPLNWTLVWFPVRQGWADGCIRWGSQSEDEIDRDGPQVNDCFGGYVYLNWSMIRLTGERSPGMSAADMDAAFFGDHPDIPPYEPHPDDQRPDLSAKVEETMGIIMSATEIPDELQEDRQKILDIRAERPRFESLGDQELVDHARSLGPVIREFFEPYFVYGSASSIGLGMLSALCADMDPSLVGRLVSGVGDIDSAPPSEALWDLSRAVRASDALAAAFDGGLDGLGDRLESVEGGPAFLTSVEQFRREHGARGPAEWEIGRPSWETAPELVLALIDRLRLADDDLSPANRHRAAAADREAAEAEARQAFAGNDQALETLELGLRLSKIYAATRERTKLTEMMAIHEVRVTCDALGQRMADRGVLDRPDQIFMLIADELDAFVADPASFLDTVRERERGYAELCELQEPFIIYGEVPPLGQWEPRAAHAEPVTVGEEIQGVPGCPGLVTGRARVITDPGDPRGLEPGEILVAPLTDPAWTPLFVPAAGVVVEVGAPYSHAIIVSREFGVPCVTGILGAASRIPDGALVQIDGGTGIVTVLELS